MCYSLFVTLPTRPNHVYVFFPLFPFFPSVLLACVSSLPRLSIGDVLEWRGLVGLRSRSACRCETRLIKCSRGDVLWLCGVTDRPSKHLFSSSCIVDLHASAVQPHLSFPPPTPRPPHPLSFCLFSLYRTKMINNFNFFLMFPLRDIFILCTVLLLVLFRLIFWGFFLFFVFCF